MIAQPQADGSRRKSDDDAACNTDEPLTSAMAMSSISIGTHEALRAMCAQEAL